MHNHSFLLPELIDDVFQYLQKGDLYRCSQVNRQFNARAIPLLYRTVELFFHAPVWYPKAKEQENGVWSQLCHDPEILLYIHELKICILHNPRWQRGGRETDPPFEKRVEYILCQGRNIRRLSIQDFGREVRRFAEYEIVVGPRMSPDLRMTNAAQYIFNVLEELEGHREITLDLWNVSLQGDQEFLLRLGDKSQVVNLSANGFHLPSDCLLLQPFSKLRQLCLRDHIETPNFEALEFETVFENTPLQYLQINVSNIESLPRTLEELRIGGGGAGKVLTRKTWQAVSRLRHLTNLTASHERLEQHWAPFAFESENLRSVILSFTRETNSNRFEQQILSPVLASSRSLYSFMLSPQLLSASTFKSFSNCPESHSITVLNIYSHYTTFDFEDLVVSICSLPGLQHLTMPWPVMFSPYPFEVSELQTNVGAEQSTSEEFDQPDVLHFTHCEAIAASCPSLAQISFFVEEDVLADEHDYHFFREEEEDSEEDPDTDEEGKAILPLDPENLETLDTDQWSLIKRSQQFKNGRFVSVDNSPCLHVCTVFYDACDSDSEHEISLLVLLNQVRKHTGFV